MSDRDAELQRVESERVYLEKKINEMLDYIGNIPIANRNIMPYGWRKAAKGRTVWRIIEEVISQNLEKNARKLGFQDVEPADSEVGVYDFRFTYNSDTEAFVNIKSAVVGGKRNKDDISKAKGLIDFYRASPNANLYVATFFIRFNEDMTISIIKCVVFPIAWIPDIYVNPSNNGNLQSADYKHMERAIKRTNSEFFDEFLKEYNVALEKKRKKI